MYETRQPDFHAGHAGLSFLGANLSIINFVEVKIDFLSCAVETPYLAAFLNYSHLLLSPVMTSHGRWSSPAYAATPH
jgi:hypothetical protein